MTREADGLQYGSRASYGTALSGCDTNAARFTTVADMQAWLIGQPAEETFMAGLTDDQQTEMYQWLKRLSFGLDSASDTPFTERAELTHLLRSVSTQARANGTSLTALAGTVADAATHDEIAAVLAAIASQPTGAVDVAALAIALAAELGPDLAQQVADEL